MNIYFVKNALLLILVIFNFACFSSNETRNENTLMEKDKSQILQIENKKSRAEKSFAEEFFANDKYKGCWSSLDGRVISIDDNTIKIWSKDVKPIMYRKVDTPLKESGILIQLENRPQFYYFQEYNFIKVKKTDEIYLKVVLYQSYEDFMNDKSVGYTADWIRVTNCKKFFPDN